MFASTAARRLSLLATRLFSTTTATMSNNGTATTTTNAEFATFAAGCFWGVQHLFDKHYKTKGLLASEVGYANGLSSATNPTYKQVCTGTTNHAEVVRLQFDPAQVSYEELVTFFFRIHDPTTVNRQGPDVGTQYRSGIYYYSPAQKETAEVVKQRVQKYFPKPIATEITPIDQFYTAEDYHQKYLVKNPDGYECPSHFVREFKG
ncbi:peptide-methionine (S)-S-oxide reductase [Allomyces macrogynus ATCC 38327]|uniref:peptide-methionine (S)-S-oxide reductase n=1 Tax=Allomyces macrogynus (strain ATCC 38327) TaxID=578462 RepID=A0A0L0SVK3_ALLM3|nr:peptide-methionine (S)-S-oxide reductase [Allomyces macrogynus ATCC 38327]|eukprot:KNE66379.1 peptide-methionine (S)-S-oxide reductase [Allomyces macrogynus ATCC 38327]